MAQTPSGMVQVTVPHGLTSNIMSIQVPAPSMVQQVMMQPLAAFQQAQTVSPQPFQQVQAVVSPQQVIPQAQPMSRPPIPQAQPVSAYPQAQPVSPQMLGAAPQPQMMMQQQQAALAATPAPSTASAASKTDAGAAGRRGSKAATPSKPARQGKIGEKLYEVAMSPLGTGCEGCCDRKASPVGLLEKARKLPPELSEPTDMSQASWELILEKLVRWQTRIYPAPCCEPLCLYTGGCCCACAPCLMCQYSSRDSWEEKLQREMNEMLEAFNVEAKFEKEGCDPSTNAVLRFYWR